MLGPLLSQPTDACLKNGPSFLPVNLKLTTRTGMQCRAKLPMRGQVSDLSLIPWVSRDIEILC